MTRAHVCLTAAAIPAALLLAGCGGGGGPSGIASQALKAITSGDYAKVCEYMPSDVQTLCTEGAGSEGSVMTGTLKTAHISENGDEALVSVTGRACVSDGLGGKTCGTNHDPDAGLPRSQADFADAYNQSVNGDSDTPNEPAFWTIALVKQNGKWYLNAGA